MRSRGGYWSSRVQQGIIKISNLVRSTRPQANSTRTSCRPKRHQPPATPYTNLARRLAVRPVGINGCNRGSCLRTTRECLPYPARFSSRVNGCNRSHCIRTTQECLLCPVPFSSHRDSTTRTRHSLLRYSLLMHMLITIIIRSMLCRPSLLTRLTQRRTCVDRERESASHILHHAVSSVIEGKGVFSDARNVLTNMLCYATSMSSYFLV